MATPRSYVKTQSLRQGQTLKACASFGVGSSGSADWRVLRVTGFAGGAAPEPDDPTGVDITATLTSAPSNPISLPTAPPLPFNAEEVGYGWPEYLFGLPLAATPGLYAIQFRVPGSTWKSGGTAYFILRSASSAPTILLCWPFSTTCAYAGGPDGQHVNLYDSFQSGRLRRVSLERPFQEFPFGDKRLWTVVYPFFVWQYLLSRGISVEPCTSFDLHADGTLLTGAALFISAGHDEYWSKEMRDRVEAFVFSGKNAAFFSANTCWWQVRFEDGGRTMVCFKSAVEDPLSGVDNARVTGNWASGPTARPENSLTGVSYRRGSAFGAAPSFTVRRTSPFFANTNLVVNGTFGAGLLNYETDAVDFDRASSPPVPTFLDGTPSTFSILATADNESSTGQPGWATLGTFTNVGTVFNAATTEWAGKLNPSAPDAVIQQITYNVVSILASAATGPAATFSPGPAPPSAWAPVPNDASGASAAIAGCPTGHLFRMRPSGTKLQRRDPEVLAAPMSFADTSIPQLTDVRALTTDLFGRFVFAGFGPSVVVLNPIRRRSANPRDAAAWQDYIPAPLSAQACVGLAALNDLFAAFDGGGERSLYVTSRDSIAPVWTRLGRWPTTHVALTGFDGKLFAATSTGELFCREASSVDLTWMKIGTVPAQTFNLAAYYGRLFALTGTSASATLQWTSATAPAGFKNPSVLFVNSGGTAQVGTIAGNGTVTPTGTSSPAVAFSIVTRANDGLVFFYRADGSATLGRFAQNGAFTSVRTWGAGSFGQWTSIVYVNNGTNEHVLFYKTGGTLGVVGRFDPVTGVFASEWSSNTFQSGWTIVSAANDGTVNFYNGSTGGYAFGAVATNGVFSTYISGSGMTTGWTSISPAGQGFLFFYRASDGRAALGEYRNGAFTTYRVWTGAEFGLQRLLVGCSNGVLLAFDFVQGSGKSWGFSVGERALLREYPNATWGVWGAVVPLAVL
jgi:hypothetical protein